MCRACCWHEENQVERTAIEEKGRCGALARGAKDGSVGGAPVDSQIAKSARIASLSIASICEAIRSDRRVTRSMILDRVMRLIASKLEREQSRVRSREIIASGAP